MDKSPLSKFAHSHRLLFKYYASESDIKDIFIVMNRMIDLLIVSIIAFSIGYSIYLISYHDQYQNNTNRINNHIKFQRSLGLTLCSISTIGFNIFLITIFYI